MAVLGSITSSNAVIALSIGLLYPAPQRLAGFAADDIYDTPAISPVEAMMGADGRLSAGYVPVPVMQTFNFMADSESILIFEAWYAAMKVARDVLSASAITTLPATGRTYVHTRGWLTSFSPMPSAKKVLQPRQFTITWQDVSAAPF
jgi:hypothetical protein